MPVPLRSNQAFTVLLSRLTANLMPKFTQSVNEACGDIFSDVSIHTNPANRQQLHELLFIGRARMTNNSLPLSMTLASIDCLMSLSEALVRNLPEVSFTFPDEHICVRPAILRYGEEGADDGPSARGLQFVARVQANFHSLYQVNPLPVRGLQIDGTNVSVRAINTAIENHGNLFVGEDGNFSSALFRPWYRRMVQNFGSAWFLPAQAQLEHRLEQDRERLRREAERDRARSMSRRDEWDPSDEDDMEEEMEREQRERARRSEAMSAAAFHSSLTQRLSRFTQTAR